MVDSPLIPVVALAFLTLLGVRLPPSQLTVLEKERKSVSQVIEKEQLP